MTFLSPKVCLIFSNCPVEKAPLPEILSILKPSRLGIFISLFFNGSVDILQFLGRVSSPGQSIIIVFGARFFVTGASRFRNTLVLDDKAMEIERRIKIIMKDSFFINKL